MSVSYDVFTGAFLEKILAYGFPNSPHEANAMVDGYMKRAITRFQRVCHYDLTTTGDDNIRVFGVDILPEHQEEIADIVSEGMVEQWLKPQLYRQENFENALSTKDFSVHSPASLLYQIRETHKGAKRNFTHMIREYTYNHGDLTGLSL